MSFIQSYHAPSAPITLVNDAGTSAAADETAIKAPVSSEPLPLVGTDRKAAPAGQAFKPSTKGFFDSSARKSNITKPDTGTKLDTGSGYPPETPYIQIFGQSVPLTIDNYKADDPRHQ